MSDVEILPQELARYATILGQGGDDKRLYLMKRKGYATINEMVIDTNDMTHGGKVLKAVR